MAHELHEQLYIGNTYTDIDIRYRAHELHEQHLCFYWLTESKHHNANGGSQVGINNSHVYDTIK